MQKVSVEILAAPTTTAAQAGVLSMVYASPDGSTREPDIDTRSITGVVLIGIGLVMDSSIFFGDFTLFNIFFDGLGLFFIGKGALQTMNQSAE